MDVTCTKCGATNRDTSRFCARCGETLPHVNEGPEEGGSLDLPWLQGVQEQASKPPTEKLTGRDAPGTLKPEKQESPAQPPTEVSPPEPAPQSQTVQQSGTAETPVNMSGETMASPDEAPPGWVVSILEPAAPQPPSTEQNYEPEELAHIMPWAHGEGGPAETVAGEATPGLPPWLNDITVQETLQSSATPETPAYDDLDLEGIEPFAPPLATEEPIVRVAPTPAKPTEKVPEWLRSISTAPKDEEAATAQADEASALDTGAARTATSAEGLVEPLARNIPVRGPRPGATEAFAALLQAPTDSQITHAVPGTLNLPAGAVRETRRRGPLGWLLPDGLIYLAILAVLLAVLLVKPPFGEVNAPVPSDVQDFYNQLQSASASKPVLVVYDWDATRSGEMMLLSQAVTHHLMSRHLRFVTMSTNPQGSGFAEMVTEATAQDKTANYGYQYGRDYRVLGYMPGNDAALSALVNNFSGSLPRDYETSQRVDGSSLIPGSDIRGLEDFGLIVALASEEGELRAWIEQVGTRTNVPMIAAVPQGLQPVVRSYKDVPRSGLKAVIGGASGAVQYTKLLHKNGLALSTAVSQATITDMVNAQSVANLLVALVILAALIKLLSKRVLSR